MKVVRAALFGIGLCTILMAPCGAADDEMATPLVVGSVRDTLGNPIMAAAVTARSANGRAPETVRTDSSGTFALPNGGHAIDLIISCAYCRPLTVHIPLDGPVIAIVKRYQALLSDALTQNDVNALPYARVEEALALHPFTVVRESESVLPGTLVSDRGLGSSPILESGIPVYDVTSGSSSLYDFPQGWPGEISTGSPSSAFIYGDQGGAGTVSVSPTTNGEPTRGLAVVGDDAGVILSHQTSTSENSFGQSANARENALRVSSSATKQSNNMALGYDVVGAHAVIQDSGNNLTRHVFLGRLNYARNFEKYSVHADLTSDRGAFASNIYGGPINDQWNDIAAGMHAQTNGPVSLFAGVKMRRSSGRYDQYNGAYSELGGHIAHDILYAGVHALRQRIDGTAGVGLANVSYRGRANGAPVDHVGSTLATPSVKTALELGGGFSATIELVSSFRLPTLFERYGLEQPTALIYNRNALYSGTLQFTDSSRLRMQATAYRQTSHGLANGTLRGVGAAIAWQVLPTVSLRGWILRFDDRTTPYPQLPLPLARAQTVGATWLTYENDSRVRIDLIYRRNFVGDVVQNNIDGAVSVPLTNKSMLFLSTDRRRQLRSWDLGVRTQP